MSEKILVPVLGESITEATVSKWLKNEGDSVEADEPIVELETDKVNLGLPYQFLTQQLVHQPQQSLPHFLTILKL